MTTLAASMFNGSDQSRPARHRANDQEQHHGGRLSYRDTSTATALPMSIVRCSPVRGPSTTSTSMPMARSPWPIPAVWRPTARTPSAMSRSWTSPTRTSRWWRRRWICTATSPPRRPHRFRRPIGIPSIRLRYNNSNGTVELGGDALGGGQRHDGGVTGGQIQIDNGSNELRFVGGALDGASITRTVNLSGLTTRDAVVRL